MKYKYLVSLFLIGILFWLVGSWSKITHQAFADNVLLLAYCLLGLSVVLAIIKTLVIKDKDSFLNK